MARIGFTDNINIALSSDYLAFIAYFSDSHLDFHPDYKSTDKYIMIKLP